MTAPTPAAGEPDPRCWCCGQAYADAQLVRLGSHPESPFAFDVPAS